MRRRDDLPGRRAIGYLRTVALALALGYVLGTVALMTWLRATRDGAIASPEVRQQMVARSDKQIFYIYSWAPFCKPCVAHFEVLDELVRTRPALGVIAVCSEEFCSEGEVAALRERHLFDLVIEAGPARATVFPASLLANRQGEVLGSPDSLGGEDSAIDLQLSASHLGPPTLLLLPRAIRMVWQARGGPAS